LAGNHPQGLNPPKFVFSILPLGWPNHHHRPLGWFGHRQTSRSGGGRTTPKGKTNLAIFFFIIIFSVQGMAGHPHGGPLLFLKFLKIFIFYFFYVVPRANLKKG
jgi:hypothetical protein